MATKETICSICSKNNGRVRCEGCSRLFCYNDFSGHRLELSAQLDQTEVTRDLFWQALTEAKSNPANHILIQQINKWENDSINKIRQAAKEARELLTKHIGGVNVQLEEELNLLTNQLRQNREENDYYEPNLNQWREQLTKMKNELTRPTNVTIRNDPKPLVANIVIDISERSRQPNASNFQVGIRCKYCGVIYQRGHSKIHKENCLQDPANYLKNLLLFANETSDQSQSSDGSDDNVRIPCEWCFQQVPFAKYESHAVSCRNKEHKRLEKKLDVPCSFCDEKFKSEEVRMQHLTMCGNKTIQCPKCRKYVRRAIFAYHCENNCANPDVSSENS